MNPNAMSGFLPTPEQQQCLRRLPGVDVLLDRAAQIADVQQVPRSVLLRAVRRAVDTARHRIMHDPAGIADNELSENFLLQHARAHITVLMRPRLQRVINATGVIVHTNLGRSRLSPAVMSQMQTIAGCYSNLEYNLQAGRRGSRYEAVEELICELTGAPAAMVVNNNAAAVLLCLDTLAKGREVPVSRGELVEIGGSFRIPDVMARSGAILREVGTTNRTHLRDYSSALSDQTALLLKVHASNYSVVGFTASVALAELVALGQQHGLPVMEDLGSGTLIDFSQYGLFKEPTVQESVAAGADVVTFSGDKLLGGPQAGIIVGRLDIIERIRRNQLTRALRIDKLTLSALEGTLCLYRDPRRAVRDIPTLQMLTQDVAIIEGRARQLLGMLEACQIQGGRFEMVTLTARAGGGALPLLAIPSRGIAVELNGMSAHALERALRQNYPPLIGRIENERFVMDARTLQEDEFGLIREAFMKLEPKRPADVNEDFE